MSENYYAVYATSPPPGTPILQDDPGLHIGKLAGLREFLFRAYPELGLTSVRAWQEHLAQPGVSIRDEADRTVSLPEFMKLATWRHPEDDGKTSIVKEVATLAQVAAIMMAASAKEVIGRDSEADWNRSGRLLCNRDDCTCRWPRSMVSFRDPEGFPFATHAFC